MTHDERISSYIDNELSGEQEQEFLISLAASDGLRKSFRSELVLKNVLHRDEAATNPPRKLRGAIFGAIGLVGAGLSAQKADAATRTPHASGFLKSMFATKVNALLTAATITLSGVAGYGVHSIIQPQPTVSAVVPVESSSTMRTPATLNQVTPSVQTLGVKDVPASGSPSTGAGQEANTASVPHQRAASVSHKTDARVNASIRRNANAGPVNGTAGAGTVGIEKPTIDKK